MWRAILMFLSAISFALSGQTLSDTFNNAPDYSNDWHIGYNNGGTSLTYTTGDMLLHASNSVPYPPGSSIALFSNLTFSGDVDVSFELDHQGYGQTKVGLFGTSGVNPLVFFDLDTDDEACLFMSVPGQPTQMRCPSSQFMNRWLTLHIKLTGNSVSFFADSVLLATIPYSSPAASYLVGFGASSVPWKSGDNDTSFRRVTASSAANSLSDAVLDFSITANPNGLWSYGFASSLGGTFSVHETAQPNYVPGIDRWATPSIDPVLGVAKNTTASPIGGTPATFTYPPDMLQMHPAFDGTYEIVRWTAPTSGTFLFQGEFAGLDIVTSVADTDVHILRNLTTDLLPTTVLHGLGTQQTFSLTRTVSTGDTFDFAVGKGPSGFHQNDSTGLKVTISKVAGVSTGTINVTTNLNAASFTITEITGLPTYTGGGTFFTRSNAPAGVYAIAYGSVAGFTTPAGQTLTLAAGGSISFSGVYSPSSQLGGGGTISQAGFSSEPVNTSTGNYYASHTDLQIPGKGLSFVFTRYYNSLDTYSGPLGVGWTDSYNLILKQVGGQVVIKEADGHEDVFNVAGGGNYSPQTAGLFDSLKMNADGSFTLMRKNQTKVNFSSLGQLQSIVDRNGNTQTFGYSGGDLVTITDSSGRVYSLSYDGSNRLLTLTDPLGRTLHYSYDGAGNLISFQDALRGTTQYAYDSSHRMTTGIDSRGNTYLQNAFDALGRVTQQKNARGFATTFAYDTPATGTTTITDPLGNATKHVHDASLRLIQIIDALGGITSYTYSANNLKLSTTDQLGHTQSFAYDVNGNLTGATDANSKTTQFAYDGTNNLLQITDRLGRITHFNYDAKGNLLSVLDPASNPSAFSYDSTGQIITAKNARNFTTSFSYDSAGDLIRTTDPLSGNIQIAYDAVGRLLNVKNQLGNTATRAYDADNRLTSVADPLGDTTQFSYDANGNLTQLTDANGKITRYAYDSTNKLRQVIDAIGGATNYGYDGNTDLTAVTDAKSHTTNYAYDALRRLKATADPLGHQKRYGYDGIGNVTSTIDGNSKTNSFSYDTLNRLISMALSDGKSVSYTYDLVGNRLNMTDWHGTTQYVSDVLNRATSVTTPDGKTVGYAYDAVGNRAILTYPNGNRVQYQYDALNRLAQATDWNGNLTTYTYDTAGNLTGMNQPNRTFSAYSYDAANRLLQVTNSSTSQVLSSFGYRLDKVGNRLQVISSKGNITSYGYDDLYRLISWANPSGHGTNYTYDGVGNRLSVAAPNGTTSYTYDAADEMLTAGSASFAYDGNGSLILKTVGAVNISYAWDALNRLIAVTGGNTNTQYGYDGDGNRVQQQAGGGTYQYLNDVVASLQVVLNEAGPDGTIDYAHGLSLISESIEQKRNFYQFDGLGSVATVTNEAGAPQSNYGYDPWGQPGVPNDPPIGLDVLGTKNKYRFTGEALDPNDALLFLRD